MSNLDAVTVLGFGLEWKAFDQSGAEFEELKKIYLQYFSIFPWGDLNLEDAVGADFGCGSGRWSKFVAPYVNHMHLVDASSEALGVAKENLKSFENVTYHLGSLENAEIKDASLDFAFSLGVLHHVPDTQRAIKDISGKLKPGAPFLVYLYYAFDNRPKWFALLWKASDLLRRCVSRLPFAARSLASFVVAALVYFPLARTAQLLFKLNRLHDSFPLSFYRERSFYVMRNDALDRLGTRLEQRFTKKQIAGLLTNADFENIKFSDVSPYWCAVGRKRFKEPREIACSQSASEDKLQTSSYLS